MSPPIIPHPLSTNNCPVSVKSLMALAKHGINNVVVAIGVFDGVHLGHRKIISELLAMSKRLKAIPVVITFFPHPRQILRHEKNIHYLRTQEEKLDLLGKLGVKAVVTIPFTEDFAKQPPEHFIRNITSVKGIKLKGICVGKHWKFGSGGKGGTALLEEISAKGHFEFVSVDEVKLNGSKVSSSAIRKAIDSGDTALADRMLGPEQK
jgi:riboflavin kinase/FMN adenylyltransferase